MGGDSRGESKEMNRIHPAQGNIHKSQALKIWSNSGSLEAVRDFIRQKATESGFTRHDVGRLVLATDEAVSNILRHSYDFASDHTIEVYWHEIEGGGMVEIRDDSPNPFLPSMVDFDLVTKIKARHTNGYGKHLLRLLVDDLIYETIPGSHNKVSLVKFREGEESPALRRAKHLKQQEQTTPKPFLSLSGLMDMIHSLSHQTDDGDLIHLLLYSVMGSLSTHPVSLLIPSKNSQIRLVGQVGLPKKLNFEELQIPAHGWITENLWAQAGPVFVNDFKKKGIPTSELQVLEKLQAVLLLPVFIHHQLRGIVAVGEKRNRQTFSGLETNLVNHLTTHSLLLIREKMSEEKLFSNIKGGI